MGELLRRASSVTRSSWIDLPASAGIYVVFVESPKRLTFSSQTGDAWHAAPNAVANLEQKNEGIQRTGPTDIVYIGKGVNVRKRVRQLVRFGVGRAANHTGGEWLWQISAIANARLLTQTCPRGKEIPFEKWLLETFKNQHGDWPLANREGGSGVDLWHPGIG